MMDNEFQLNNRFYLEPFALQEEPEYPPVGPPYAEQRVDGGWFIIDPAGGVFWPHSYCDTAEEATDAEENGEGEWCM